MIMLVCLGFVNKIPFKVFGKWTNTDDLKQLEASSEQLHQELEPEYRELCDLRVYQHSELPSPKTASLQPNRHIQNYFFVAKHDALWD